MTTELLTDIATIAEELCDPRQHVELIYGWTPQRNRKLIGRHTTIQQGLITQLHQAINTNTTTDQNRRTIPASRPPLLLEALARHIDIQINVNEWIHQVRTPNRGNLESNIRALVGAAPNLPTDQRGQLLHDLRRWRSWAAVLTGWATPPLQPHVACPNPDCGSWGSLRVHSARRAALCAVCGHIWDDRDGSINLLAAHITAETSKPHSKVSVGSTAAGHGGWTERRSA